MPSPTKQLPNPPGHNGLMARWARSPPAMQQIRSPNSLVATGICDPNKSPARHHRNLKLRSKLKYLIHKK